MVAGYSHDDLRRAMKNMPEGYRTVISMKYMKKYDDKTIADNTGISLEDVRDYKIRAMKMLREEINRFKAG